MLPSEHGVDFMPSAGPQRFFAHSVPVDDVPVVVGDVAGVVVGDVVGVVVGVGVVALPEPDENDPVEPFSVVGAGIGVGSGPGAGPVDGAG